MDRSNKLYDVEKGLKNRVEISDALVLKTIMENSSDLIYFKDTRSRFTYVNNIMAQSHKAEDPSELLGKTDYDLRAESFADEAYREEKAIMRTGLPKIGKIEREVDSEGRVRYSSASKHPLYDQEGELIGTWGITRDITEIEKMREELADANARHRTMLENVSDIIEIIDVNGVVKYISPNIQNDFGWTADELMETVGFDFIHPEDHASVMRVFEKLLTIPNSAQSTECRLKCKDGQYKYIEVTGKNMLSDPLINGVLINYHDISERKRREEKIEFLSYHDSLTNLYNRTFFEAEKKRLDTERQLPLSIIMGDVNGLKLTNDTFGHAEGDKLLISVAEILRKCCRKEEIIARIGGDEFCILLPQTDEKTAQRICSNIYRECNEYKPPKGKKAFFPSISLGHATKDDLQQSIDQILKDAEDYMYQKKLLEHNTTNSSIINSMKATMHERSNYTEEHSDRMIKMATGLGAELGLTEEQLLELDLLSRLHDIGKICIDESILAKPGKLTEAEWDKVRKHPEVGYKIAQASTELVRISDLILSHHERWDGSGYPRGLSGLDIPLLSRIISIIDAYDAMTQDRPYRKAMPKEYAINEIIDNANKQFDPKIAKIFIEKVLNEKWEKQELPG